MAKTKKNAKPPWFKRKGFLHFDNALKRDEAEKYVTNPENIKRHRFSPLIHYGKVSRKVGRDKAAEKIYKDSGKIGPKPRLKIKLKERNIFYASHRDGYIYSYYAYQLQKGYEAFLEKHLLADNVIAYRSIKINDIKYCNSHFAKEAFDFVQATEGCHILCFDISKFFDRISVDVLKDKWAQVLGENQLPDDHFKVYKSLINFCYVEEGHLIENFKDRFKKNPRQHGLDKESGGSLRNRICKFPELRDLDGIFRSSGKKLINKKDVKDITGIPQGTAISGLLSNVFMIDFDLSVKSRIKRFGGFYRRYSDDIFIVVPTSISHEKVTEFVEAQLQKFCGDNIKLNENKTEKNIYKTVSDGTFQIVNLEGKESRIQYLGFHFNGRSVNIRNSSISKDRGKTVQAIRRHKKGKGKIDTRAIYREKSSRKVTLHDKIKKKGFVFYAQRAAAVHGDDNSILSQIKKNDRFIKRAVKRERSVVS